MTAVWAKFCRVATRRSNTLNIRCWPQFLSPFPLLWCDLGYTSKAGCTFLFPWWFHGCSAQRLGHPLPSFPVSFFPFPFSLLPFCLSGLGSVCFIPPFPPRFPLPLFCLLVGCFPACSLPLLCFPLFSCCCLSLAVHVPSFLPSPRLCVCVKTPQFPKELRFDSPSSISPRIADCSKSRFAGLDVHAHTWLIHSYQFSENFHLLRRLMPSQPIDPLMQWCR